MKGINISIDEVRQIATSIESLNKKLDENLRDIQKSMKNMESSWKSKAASNIQGKFDSLANKYFDKYKNVIDEYVKFLRTQVSEGYENTENQISSNADKFVA